MRLYIATFEHSWETLCPIVNTYRTGVEIQRFCGHEVLDEPDATLSEIDMLLPKDARSMHGYFYSMNPGAYDPLIRDATMSRYRQSYGVGRRLGTEHIVFHTGFTFPFPPDRYTYENFHAFWDTFLKDVADGIEFHIENMFEKRWEHHRDFVAAVADPRVSACLDIGHVNVHSRQSHAEWIKGLGDTIRYVHLHNNFGERDEHNGLGNGTVPMREVLDLLLTHAPNAVWTIENGEVEQSLHWLEGNGYL